MNRVRSRSQMPRNYAACDLSRSLPAGNGEERAALRAVFPRERAAVRFDNAARDGQAHAGPFRLGREEGLEQLIHDSIGKSRTGIAHAHADFFILDGLGPDDDAAGIGADDGQGFKRVHDQVQQHLQQLDAVPEDDPGFQPLPQ